MNTKIFILLGLIAICNAASIAILPAGHTVLRSAAPAAYLAAPGANYVLSRSIVPSYAWAQPAFRSYIPSFGSYYY